MKFITLIDHYFVRQPRLRRFVTALLERNRNSEIEVAGAHLLVNDRREHGYLRASRIVKSSGTLRDEVPVLMNLFAVVRDGDTFIDVGANVGLFSHSLIRLKAIYPNFRIIAIEANPDTFARLAAKPVDGIQYLNVAASETKGKLTFVDGAVSHVFTTVDKQNFYNIPTETIDIESVRLDELDIAGDSFIIKIDVEGQELRVLNGAKSLFDRGVVRCVYIDGYDDPGVNGFLNNYGFTFFEGRTLTPTNEMVFSLLAIRDVAKVNAKV